MNYASISHNDIQNIASDLKRSIELYIEKENKFVKLFREQIPFLCVVIDKKNAAIPLEENIIFTSFTNAAIYRKVIHKNSRISRIVSFKNVMTRDTIKKYKFDSFVYYDTYHLYDEHILKLINFKLIENYPFRNPFNKLNDIFDKIIEYKDLLKIYINLYYPHIFIVKSSRKDIRTGRFIVADLGIYSSLELAQAQVRLKSTSARLNDNSPELLREYFDDIFIKKCETALYNNDENDDMMLYCIDDIIPPFKVERLLCFN